MTEGTNLTVNGTASVGTGAQVRDTSLVYLLDVSGSMSQTAGINCDTDAGNDLGDGYDTRLVCEKQAALSVNAAASGPSGTVLNSAVIGFSSTATAATGPALTTDFGAVATAIQNLTAGGGTSFQAALTAANTILSGSTASKKLIVIISDGENGGSVSGPLTGTPVVQAFAIGGVGCGSGSGSLAAVAALGASGSACTTVTTANLPGLGAAIVSASFASSLTGLGVTVDGATVTTVTTPALPQTGPTTVTFTASVPGALLTPGTRTICAVANGSDVGGADSVSDCISLNVTAAPDATVDCSIVNPSACTVQTTDPGVASAVATGQNGFDKVLSLSVADVGALPDCGGQPCRTAFSVEFPDQAGTGKVVQLVVTMTRAQSTPPWRAAVYIDDTRISQRCSLVRFLLKREILPCVSIYYVSGLRTQYLVRLDGDPIPRFR
ncbi:MAG: VWA domain-containing protein [Acidimicrobiales bacterium]|nr:VWA domain-containing protein [Acidimicrobiales bacterium]